jgi:hypothetical protein
MGPAAGARRSGGAAMRAAAVGVAVALVALALSPPLASALRPLRERAAPVGSWGDEVRMVPPSFSFLFTTGHRVPPNPHISYHGVDLLIIVVGYLD